MNSNIPTLFVISSWQQAETIQKEARQQMMGTNSKHVPVEQIDGWYSSQGMIEWHDASRTIWKKKIQKHMQEKRTYAPLDDTYILMVIWNAQTISPQDWYMWKDLRGTVVPWFVSDSVCSMAKHISIRIHVFPKEQKQFTKLEQAFLSCVSSDTDIHWKGILDVRKAIMEFMEWSECFHPLQSSMIRIVETVLRKKQCYTAETMGYIMKHGLEPFSTIRDPLGFVLRAERIVLLLIQIIYTQREQLHTKDKDGRLPSQTSVRHKGRS